MSVTLSVVVCTRERPDAVREAVLDVLAQARPHHELVVVDQSSPPVRQALGAWLAVVGRGRVLHVADAGQGLPRARNVGLAAARAPIVLFLDDDVRLHPGCLDAHVRAFDDPAVGGVVGRIVELSVRANSATTTNRLDLGGRVRTRLDGRHPCDVATLKGAQMSYRRVALTTAGPCDVGYAGTAFLEDADWSTRVRRLGWRLRFEPAAAVTHLSAPSGGVRQGDALRTSTWRFHNTGRFVARHRPWTVPWSAATFAAIAARRAWEAGDASVAPTLLGAWWRGVRSAQSVEAAGEGAPSSGSGSSA